MFRAPGPMEVVQTMARRRRLALGEGDGGVSHALLIVRPVGRQQVSSAGQGLAQARHIAVAKDRPRTPAK